MKSPARRKKPSRKRPAPATVLRLFYFASIGAVFFSLDLILGLLTKRSIWFQLFNFLGLLGLSVLFGSGLTAFHLRDARQNGSAFLMRRLKIRGLDLRQEPHRRLESLFEMTKPVAGTFKAKPYVIPSPALDALAFVGPDGTACVAMTEGLLAGLSLEEVEAVSAREIALFEIGAARERALICALGDFFERVAATFIPERLGRPGLEERASSLLRRCLSRTLDPEAEWTADAAAAGRLRDPLALARALYKARTQNASAERLPAAYRPMLLAAPSETGENPRSAAGWKNVRLSLTARIRRLAEKAGADFGEVLRELQTGENPAAGICLENGDVVK